MFPNNLKYADVTPLYKNKAKTSKENYQSVSVLPTISKVFKDYGAANNKANNPFSIKSSKWFS